MLAEEVSLFFKSDDPIVLTNSLFFFTVNKRVGVRSRTMSRVGSAPTQTNKLMPTKHAAVTVAVSRHVVMWVAVPGTNWTRRTTSVPMRMVILQQ